MNNINNTRPCGPVERGAQGGVRVRVWCEVNGE